MNAERLLALDEKVAEAPDAGNRLRRFVLDLAVRGKLLEQDPRDELASELLKRIAAEKTRLVEAGEIRKPRDLANGEELQPTFDIPNSWLWCRLDTVGAIIGGGTPSAGDPENFAEPGSGIPWLTPADLGGYADLFIERGARDLTEKGLASSSATMMPAGTVLFTSRAPIGYVAIASNPISTNQGFKSIVPYVADCSRFIALAMQTFAPEIDAKAPGTTFKEVSGKIVAGVPFPLPPLAEQRRIVAKVEELMALLDRLEAARGQREATRDRLTAASLARLTTPDADPAKFPVNARFAHATLPALTTRPDQIKPLRQTILNLAVRGKLVDQDPTDDPIPSAKLLKKPDRKQPTGRTGASLGPVERSEVGFDLPQRWTWSRLFQICEPDAPIVYGILQPGPDIRPNGVPYIRPSEINDGRIDLRSIRYTTSEIAQKYSRASVRAGDLLMTIVGTIGAVAEVPPELDGGNITQSSCRLRTQPCLVRTDFLRIALTSDCAVSQIDRMRLGAAVKRLNIAHVRAIAIPLPPLAEQHRIVAKVDALMALCDRLEAALTTADTTRARLLEALLHDALDPAASLASQAAE